MLKKSYSKTGNSCRVTFKLAVDPAAAQEAENVAILGEFNEWDQAAHPMKRLKDGSFSATLSLDSGRDYRFRYLLDGSRWINDETPDRFEMNRFGGEDCVIAV